MAFRGFITFKDDRIINLNAFDCCGPEQSQQLKPRINFYRGAQVATYVEFDTPQERDKTWDDLKKEVRQ